MHGGVVGNEGSLTILCINLKHNATHMQKHFYFRHFLWILGDWNLETNKHSKFTCHFQHSVHQLLMHMSYFSVFCTLVSVEKGLYKRTLTGTFITESSQLRNNKDPATKSFKKPWLPSLHSASFWCQPYKTFFLVIDGGAEQASGKIYHIILVPFAIEGAHKVAPRLYLKNTEAYFDAPLV